MEKRLVAYRERSGYSVSRVAFELGVQEETVRMWENGKAMPTADQTLKMAQLYRCRLADLAESSETAQKTIKNVEKRRGYKEYTLLVTAAYLVLGAVCGLWHPGWMVFLALPLYSVDEKTKNSWRILGHPMAAVILYLTLGFTLGLWHPGWLIFLLIPGVPMIEKSIAKSK